MDILHRTGRADSLEKGFKDRLHQHFDDLFRYFHQLYPYRDDVWEHLDRLVNVLIVKYDERSSRLKSIDTKRLANPQWFLSEHIIGMMLYVDHFAGDLKGLERKLPYLEELGINLLHLMPILKAPKNENDGGYAVSNYHEVDSKYGTMEDVRHLAEKLHRKEMLLMMDFVLNHTSDQHAWAEKAKAGDAQHLGYYHFYDDRAIPNQFEHSLPEVFPQSSPGNFTYIEDLNKWVMTVFNSYQWDLNYANPRVFIEMVDVLLFLSNQGIDILRLDALAFMWKRMGTDSQNLPEAHLLVKAMKSCAKIAAPGTAFLAEAIVAPDEIVKYFGSGSPSDECDMAYNATFMVMLWDAIATKSIKLTKVTLENIPKKPAGSTWLNYARCHDDIGLGYEDLHAQWAGYDSWSHRRFLVDFFTEGIDWSFARGKKFMENQQTGDARISGSLASLAGLEKGLAEENLDQIDEAIKRILLLHSIILSYGGIPMLYAGDEIGMINDYSFEQDPSRSMDNRWMHRPMMDWKMAERRKLKDSVECSIFYGIQHLIQVRKQSPEMADHANSYMVDCHNERLFSYIRMFENHKTWIICNLNDHPENLSLDMVYYMGFDAEKGLKDKVTGDKVQFKDYKYTLQPYQFIWAYQPG